MKKIICILPLLLLLGSMARVNAQAPDFAFTTNSDPERRISFGIDAALDFHFLMDDETYIHSRQPQLGFSTRGWMSMRLRDKLALQVGLGYALRRHDYTIDSLVFSSDIDPQSGIVTYSSIEMDLALHEIQVPVLLRYSFQNSERGFYVAGGPFLSWAVLARSNGVVHGGNGTTEYLNARRFDEGLSLGLQACFGRTLPLGPSTRMGVEIYGNIHAGAMRIMPAVPSMAGLRLCFWR
jgi:hypothetical protein